MELYDEDFIKKYIARKKKESYNYLCKSVDPDICSDFSVRFNDEKLEINDKKICIVKYDDFCGHDFPLTNHHFNDIFKSLKKNPKKDLLAFLLLNYQYLKNTEKNLKSNDIAFRFKVILEEYIVNNIKNEFSTKVLIYLMCSNFGCSNKYVDELIIIYLNELNLNNKYFNEIYLLLTFYGAEKKIEQQMSELEDFEIYNNTLNDMDILVAGMIKSYCSLKKEIALLKDNKNNNEKRVLGEQPSSKENIIHDNNQKIVQMPILDDSKEQVNQRIKEILKSLNYINKEELKKQLTELKQCIETLNEQKLFNIQINELVSYDNYEDDEAQKQLLNFIDTNLKHNKF